MQLTYPTSAEIGFAGMRADNRPAEFISKLNDEASANLPCGVMVQQGATDAKCLLPTAAANKMLGLVVSSFNNDSASLATNGAVAPYDMASIARKGAFYVLPEEDVEEGEAVYVRYTAGGAGETVGRLRNDLDGTAQVTTITPTAVHSTAYSLSVNGRGYFFTSDADSTATEIVTGFKDLINADAGAVVTASGTATLILTADEAGAAFTTSLGANLAAAATTANAAKAVLLAGARWASTADADTPAILELNLPA